MTGSNMNRHHFFKILGCANHIQIWFILILRAVCRCIAKLLIIDDLGAERSTDFALEKVYNVVDSRYRAKRPIILTTNLSMEEMKETLDIRYTRIFDRIFEMCYPMQFKGLSWRKGEAARRYNDTKSFLEGDDG